MKKILVIHIIFALCNTICFAQNDFDKEFEAFMAQTQQEFNDFKTKCNEEYIEHLNRTWKEFNSLKPIPYPKDTLTVHPVIFEEDKENKEKEEIQYKELILADTVTKILPTPIIAEPQVTIPDNIQEEEYIEENNAETHSFSFYGTEATVHLGEEHRFQLSNCNNEDIIKAWRFCTDRYENVVKECIELQRKHNLCDWGYLHMLKKMSEQFLGVATNEATFVTSYIYCQSGYKTRMGLSNERLYLLVACEHQIYGKSFFNIGGTQYYPIDCKEDQMKICDAEFNGSRPLSLLITGTPVLKYANSDTVRILKSKRFPEMNISVNVNKNLIDFYNDYPVSEMGNDFMTKWTVYANNPLEENIKEQIYPKLEECIKGKSIPEQVNMLLNFVQTAFVYEYDENIWGYDRSFFAEETLYYEYCDCEDRSILFSRLVRDLIGLKVLLIYYPGHIATAVCINNEAQGDYLEVNNEKFTICDPTYINAPIGESMPELRNSDIVMTLLD